MPKRTYADAVASARAAIATEEHITAAIALPADVLPVRYRDQFTAQESALVKCVRRLEAKWSDTPLIRDNGLTPTDQLCIFLFRQALRCAVIQEHWNTATAIATRYYWYPRASDSRTFTVQNGSTHLEPKYAMFVSGENQYQGQYLYSGFSKRTGRYYIWSDMNLLNVVLTNASPGGWTGYITFNVYSYFGGTEFCASTIKRDAPWGANTTVTLMGTNNNYEYLALEAEVVQTSLGASSQILFDVYQEYPTLAAGHEFEIWRHWPFTDIENKNTVATTGRIIGSAVLASNTSPENYKQGQIVAVQMQNNAWENVIYSNGATTTPYDFLAALSGAEFLMADKGIYAFIKPGSVRDMEYNDIFTEQESTQGLATPAPASFELDEVDCVGICLKIPQSAGAVTSTGHSFTITLSHSLEFQTLDQWFLQTIATANPQEWTNALMVLSSMQQFYENPVHWRTILHTIGKYARVAPEIGRLFGPLGAELGELAAGAGRLLMKL